MLKKILSLVALGSLFASSALADDVLALVTKGKVTSDSAGVTKLSLDDKMQVKGGYGLLQTDAGQQVFTLMNLNTGITKIAQIGVVIGLSPFEKHYEVSCGFGSLDCIGLKDDFMSKSNYRDLASIANPNLGQYLAITTTKTIMMTPFGIPKIQFAEGFAVVGVYGENVYKIRNTSASGIIANDMRSRFQKQLNNISVIRY